MCPVGSTDTGADALGGINADRKGRAEDGRIVGRLRIEAERIAFVGRQRQADKAAAEGGHEVDNLRRYLLSGADQISLIFAVFVIDKHDHLARATIGQNLRYITELYCHVRIPGNDCKDPTVERHSIAATQNLTICSPGYVHIPQYSDFRCVCK